MSQTIYVKLLDEGVEFGCPILAEARRDSEVFLILPQPSDHMPNGEDWEFKPGTRVLTKEIKLDGSLVRVAYKKID